MYTLHSYTCIIFFCFKITPIECVYLGYACDSHDSVMSHDVCNGKLIKRLSSHSRASVREGICLLCLKIEMTTLVGSFSVME